MNKKGVITQASTEANVRALINVPELNGVNNYTFEVDAMKTDGAEGFLIMFGVKGENLYWWNLGGWGNTRSTIGNNEALGVQAGQWNKI